MVFRNGLPQKSEYDRVMEEIRRIDRSYRWTVAGIVLLALAFIAVVFGWAVQLFT